jgi:hypothetical protein
MENHVGKLDDLHYLRVILLHVRNPIACCCDCSD